MIFIHIFMQMSINVCVFWMFINHMKHDSGFECAFYGEGLTTGQLGSQLVNLAHNWSTWFYRMRPFEAGLLY